MQAALELLARIGASAFKRTGRALMATALAFAMLTASMHHWSCFAGDEGGSAAAATVSIRQQAPLPADQDQCLPGHCHCVCHANTDIGTEAVSVPVEFADAGYRARVPELWHSCTVRPPFEPPCA